MVSSFFPSPIKTLLLRRNIFYFRAQRNTEILLCHRLTQNLPLGISLNSLLESGSPQFYLPSKAFHEPKKDKDTFSEMLLIILDPCQCWISNISPGKLQNKINKTQKPNMQILKHTKVQTNWSGSILSLFRDQQDARMTSALDVSEI